MVEILFLNISSFKTQSFDLFCFSILTCNGANDWRNATSSNLDLFLSKAQKQDSTRKLRFYFDQMFHKSYSIIRINRLCCGKLKTSSYSSGPTWGPTKQNWENLWGSFSRVIQLGFLRSLVSSLRCEANQINWWREERPIAFNARHHNAEGPGPSALSPARHVAAANARAEVRARMHTSLRSIWCQGSSRTIGYVTAHSKTRYAREELT